MKKKYNNPEISKIDINTEDIMTLSDLLSIDDGSVDNDGNFITAIPSAGNGNKINFYTSRDTLTVREVSRVFLFQRKVCRNPLY